MTAESASPPQPSQEEKGKEVIQSDKAMIGSSQDCLEMLRSGIPVEPLGVEHMDWVQDPEDEIFLGCMVSANNIYCGGIPREVVKRIKVENVLHKSLTYYNLARRQVMCCTLDTADVSTPCRPFCRSLVDWRSRCESGRVKRTR